jgi:hypothetical protein
MVIKSVLFSGALSDKNTLELTLDETYLPIRMGEWRLRIDSMTVTMPEVGNSLHVALSISLLQSPQEVNVLPPPPNDVPLKRIKVVKPTPLYVFCLTKANSAYEKKPVLFTREGVWFNFTNGTPRVELRLQNLEDPRNKPMGLTVHGILLFECVQ